MSFAKVLKQVNEKALACGRNPDEITLLAISKNCSVASMQVVYSEGARNFGESRIQEALPKIPAMPSDCRWHMIGTLQSNKVTKAVTSFQLIHSVDTPQLAAKISQVCLSLQCTASILLQVNTSGEKSKHGMPPDDWEEALAFVNQLPNLRIEGLMTMAPLTEDHLIIRNSFRKLRHLRAAWRSRMKDPILFQHLSMGMSHDFLIAIEEGATLLRIGTAIFSP